MELQFKENACSCLDTALREVQNLEQTQELKLTEGMPDIGRILGAWGQTVLRGKEWQGESVSLSGGIMVWVLYAPEDGSEPRCLESWIPFQMRWELPLHTPEGMLRMHCLTRFVDARSVSARKIMVRCGVAAMAEAFCPMEAKWYGPENIPEGVELLRRTYPVRLPRESGEKTFLMEEELTFPASAPQPEKLISYAVYPQPADRKVIGNKILFRGSVILHVLYASEEGQLYSWDFELPFSQFSELDNSFTADASGDVLMDVTSVELELSDEGQLGLKAGMVAQYVVDDVAMMELVEDAYSPGRELEVQTQPLELPVILETRRENLYGEQAIPEDANIAVDVQFLPDFPRQQRTENGVMLLCPGTFQVLYYGQDGALHSANLRWEGKKPIPADENSRITAVPVPMVAQSSLGGNLTAKAEIPLQLTVTGTEGIPMVTGLELGQQRQPDPGRPSLILQRAGETGLWEIAKMSGSTMEAIRQANHLKEDPTPGQMLLIPVN